MFSVTREALLLLTNCFQNSATTAASANSRIDGDGSAITGLFAFDDPVSVS